MSGFFSPKYLLYRDTAGRTPAPIKHDVHCTACGYNLRGLCAGGRCPECGMFIDPNAASPMPLVPEEPAQRTRLVWGLFLIWTTMIVTAGLRLVALASVFGTGMRYTQYAIAMIVISSLWCLGVWWTTPDRFAAIHRTLAHERKLVRWGAMLLPLGYILLTLGYLRGNVTLETMSHLIRLCGGCAAFMHLHLVSVGAWHSEFSEESDRLYNLAFWTAIGSPLIIFAPLGGAWLMYIWIMLAIILWAIAVVRTAWIVRAIEQQLRYHSRDLARAGTRLERIMEKRAEIDREVESTIRPYRP